MTRIGSAALVLVLVASLALAAVFMYMYWWVVPAFLATAFLCVVLLLRISGYFEAWVNEPPHNSLSAGLEATIDTSISLFSAAERSIKIVSGQLRHTFYSDPQVLSSLSDATMHRNVRIDIRAGTGYDQDNAPFFDFVRNHDTVSFDVIPYVPERHFMLVDGRHFRLEDSHEPNATNVAARIRFDDPSTGSELSEAFGYIEHHIVLKGRAA